MKNLKKVLALGLALIMLLGMFTVASAAETEKKLVATDLSDFNTVTHKEAVSLMVDLGVIKGLPDGTYAPANTIDRASWAKMVYFVITNEEDASVYIPDGNVFPDVPSTHWAAGEIAYLKTLGIVAGDGTGYRPSDEITMVEAYKMMLTGIGYSSKHEHYENDANWAGNIMKDATRRGLTEDINARQSDKLTRDNAAQIVYNALDCRVVELSEKEIGNIGTMIDGYNYFDTLAYENFKIQKLLLTLDSVDADGIATFSGVTGGKMNKVKASAADVGRTVRIWANVTRNETANGYTYNYNSAKSTSAFPADITPVKTVTGGIKTVADIFTSGKDDYASMPANATNDGGVKLIIDGAEASDFSVSGAVVTDTSNELKNAAISGNVVDYYDDDEDGDIDLIKVTTWTPAEVKADPKTKTNADDKTEVAISGVLTGYVLAERVSGYEDLKKGDVVLVNDSTIDSGNVHVYTIEKAESVSGKVTAKSSKGEITVDGAKYKKSATATGSGVSTAFDAWADFDSEFTFYLAKDGKICFGVITEEGIDSSKVAMVVDSMFVEGGDIGVANNLRAKLLFTDGTTENVTVSKIDGKKVVKGSTTETDEVQGNPTADTTALTATTAKKFYNYKVTSDGKYELTAMDKTAQEGKWENGNSNPSGNVTIAQKPLFDGTNSANNKTLFIVGKEDSDGNVTYSLYTGFAEVPKMNNDAVKNVLTAVEDGASVAKYVYIQATAFADDKPEGLVFIRDNGYTYNKTDDCYEINIVDANGAATTLKVASDVSIGGSTISWSATCLDDKDLTLYTVEKVTDGVVDELKTVTNSDANVVFEATDIKTGAGVVTANGGSYAIDDDTVLVYIDLKSKDSENASTAVYGSCGTFDADDLSVSTDEYPSGVKGTILYKDNTAQFIYVVRDGSAV